MTQPVPAFGTATDRAEIFTGPLKKTAAKSGAFVCSTITSTALRTVVFGPVLGGWFTVTVAPSAPFRKPYEAVTARAWICRLLAFPSVAALTAAESAAL